MSVTQEFVKCGKPGCKKCASGPGHGPYWYEYWREGEKIRKRYLGKTLDGYETRTKRETASERAQRERERAEAERARARREQERQREFERREQERRQQEARAQNERERAKREEANEYKRARERWKQQSEQSKQRAKAPFEKGGEFEAIFDRRRASAALARRILELAAGHSDRDLILSYRRLAFAHHPDRGGSTHAFQIVQSAFDFLKRKR